MLRTMLLLGPALLAAAACAQELAPVSEKDFFSDVPLVLSVARLPQRLEDTPGAVTILDRDTIRRSGARDVADLLRLVPGFRVSDTFQSNAPQGSYHIGLGDYNVHLQVLVDGRSVYSPFLNGGTGPGLQTVALEDIERIEVHRGSNSAAYGARAFLGTLNIITRSPALTRGTTLAVSGGDNGILDGFARHGWGDDRASYRLSVDQRADRGFAAASGPAAISRVNLRADFNLNRADQLELRAGQSQIAAGAGFAGQFGDAPRTRSIDTGYLQLDWKRSLDADQDLALQYSYMQEKTTDNFPFLDPGTPGFYGRTIDFGGSGNIHSLSATLTRRWGTDLRLAWGAEWRREGQVSRPKFDTDAELSTEFGRLFGHVEWHLRRDLVLNAGGMFEHNSMTGDALAPRVMLHWHVAPGHSLRYGLSRAHRTPSMFEQFAHVVYRNPAAGFSYTTFQANQPLQAERILAREAGYLGRWPQAELELDVRLFEEGITDLIKEQRIGSNPKYFANAEDFSIRGGEAQLRWQPWRAAQLLLAYSLSDSTKSLQDDNWRKPVATKSLMFSQGLPGDLDASLLYYQIDALQFPGSAQLSPPTGRTDLRLAKAMRWGARRGELALVVQNLGQPYPDFLPTFYFRQQAFLTLRVEH